MVDNSRNKVKHGQSAVEFLSTYSWAFLIIVGAIAVVYFLINELLVAVPSQCTFTVAVPCSDIVITSNTANSIYQVFLTNGQDFAIKNPRLYINVSTYGNLHAVCGPSFVLSGGAIICNATTSSPFTIGTTLTGFMVFNQSVCTQIGTASCTTSVPESFNGTFTTRTGPYTTISKCTIGLVAATSTPAVGSADLLTATVGIGSVTIPGATVNFTSSNSIGVIAPSYSLSNVNGSAVSYITSAVTGNVIVTAKYLKGCSATVSLSFVPPTTSTSTTVPISSSTLSSSTVSSSSTTSTLSTTTTILGSLAYIANYGNSDVDIISTATNTIVATCCSFSEATGISIAPSGTFGYISSLTSAVDKFSPISNSILGSVSGSFNDPYGSPKIMPNGAIAYLPNYGSGTISVISTSSNSVVSTVSGGPSNPWDVGIAPGGTYGYIGGWGSEPVYIFNTATNAITGEIGGGSTFIDPWGIAFAPSGTYAYISNYGDSNVVIVNTATNAIVGAISGTTTNPSGIAFAPSGTYAYIASWGSSVVYIVNTATNSVTGTISVGSYSFSNPDGIAFSVN